MVKRIISCSMTLLIFSLTWHWGIKSLAKEADDGTQSIVDEMVTTPERQQRALDRLSLYSKEMLVKLMPYFSDNRSVASTDVRFLNPSPNSFEKYYMTSSYTVNEVIVRYICWRTEFCNLNFDRQDIKEIEKKIIIGFDKNIIEKSTK